MYKNNIAVFDFETSGLDVNTCQILEIGCCILNGNTYDIIDKFHTLVKPDNADEVSKEALSVNKLTLQELENSPPSNIAFPAFAQFLQKHNIYKNKNSGYGAPILAGYNIRGFDYPIIMRYAKRFGFIDSKGRPQIFHPQFIIDAMDHLFLYARKHPDFKSMKLTAFLEYAGINLDEIKDSAHGAMWDTEMTARIIQKFCKLADFMISKTQNGKRRLEFKDCMVK